MRSRDSVILADIQRHVIRELNQPTDRRSDCLHPSQIVKAGWCWRQSFYELTGVFEPEPVPTSFQQALIFEEGHRIHEKYQRWLLDMGKAYAVEYEVEHHGLNIAGAIDVVLDHGPVIEIKSIGIGTVRHENPGLFEAYQNGLSVEDLWGQINRPFPTHLRQAFLYIWLLRTGYFDALPEDEDWLRQVDQAVLLYEFKPNQQVKEFVVNFNQAMIQPILDGANEVTLSVKHGIIPDRPRWAEEEHRQCKGCPYRKACWHGKSTPTQVPVKRASARLRRKALGRPTDL